MPTKPIKSTIARHKAVTTPRLSYWVKRKQRQQYAYGTQQQTCIGLAGHRSEDGALEHRQEAVWIFGLGLLVDITFTAAPEEYRGDKHQYPRNTEGH